MTQHKPSTAPIYKLPNGGYLAVPQLTDYKWRGRALGDYALHEYVCLTRTVPITDDNREAVHPYDMPFDQASPVEGRGAGRPRNGMFSFSPRHPLHSTHAQQLVSKPTIPKFAGTIPRYPGPRPSQLTERWKRDARAFARFALAVYKPWNHETGQPESVPTWAELCEWTYQLRSQQPAPLLNRVRLRWLTNLGFALHVSTRHKKLQVKFRSQAATVWKATHLDDSVLLGHLRPQSKPSTDPSDANIAASVSEIEALQREARPDQAANARFIALTNFANEGVRSLGRQLHALDAKEQTLSELAPQGQPIAMPDCVLPATAQQIENVIDQLRQAEPDADNEEHQERPAQQHVHRNLDPTFNLDATLNDQQGALLRYILDNMRQRTPVTAMLHGGPGATLTHANAFPRAYVVLQARARHTS